MSPNLITGDVSAFPQRIVVCHLCHWSYVSLVIFVTGHLCHLIVIFVTGHFCHGSFMPLVIYGTGYLSLVIYVAGHLCQCHWTRWCQSSRTMTTIVAELTDMYSLEFIWPIHILNRLITARFDNQIVLDLVSRNHFCGSAGQCQYLNMAFVFQTIRRWSSAIYKWLSWTCINSSLWFSQLTSKTPLS